MYCKSKGSDDIAKNSSTSGSGARESDNTRGYVEMHSKGNKQWSKHINVVKTRGVTTKGDVKLYVGAASCSQPVLTIKVECLNNDRSKCAMVDAVADAGAEICIAGIMQAKCISINVSKL